MRSVVIFSRRRIVKEAFYRTGDGKVIFHAIPNVGTGEAVSFSDTHGWDRNAFPDVEAEIGPEIVWSAYAHTAKVQTSK